MRTLPLVLALGLLAGAAQADVVTLEPSKDNTLYNNASGGTSNGSGEYFFAGRNANMAAFPIRRGLLAFDLSGTVPPGSTVTAVTLDVSVSMAPDPPTPQNFSLHRVTQDWGEGASDAPGSEGAGDAAQAGDATWLHTFYSGSFWSSPGGDFVSTSSVTISIGPTGFYAWGSTSGMVADVQAWVDDPAQNFGWLVRGNEGSSKTARRFDGKDSPFPSLYPKLEVTFTPPPPPPTIYCTSKTTSSGCTPTIGSSGIPSATAGSGFVVSTTQVEPGNLGIFFYGQSGQAALSFQGAFLCVQPPTLRTPATSSGPGGTCGGTYSIDFNDYIVNGSDASLVAGATVNLQNWFRDPPNPLSGTGLSDGIEFTIAP